MTFFLDILTDNLSDDIHKKKYHDCKCSEEKSLTVQNDKNTYNLNSKMSQKKSLSIHPI